MYISKAPLRISIGGGGTDLPAFYENSGTTFSSLAIDKYITVVITERFTEKFFIRYLENEEVSNVYEINHDIIRTVLQKKLKPKQYLEIASFADVPGGTGLGSSGTFTVALLSALNAYLGRKSDQFGLAQEATQIEMNDLQRPIGLQDQYIAAFGGFTKFNVTKSGFVKPQIIQLHPMAKDMVNKNLLLFYCGDQRDASKLLQFEKTEILSEIKSLHKNTYKDVLLLGKEMTESIQIGNIKEYGRILGEYWAVKRERQKHYTDTVVNEIYEIGLQNGALGGKLVGAGGNGFLLFATEKPEILKKAMHLRGVRELNFEISEVGVSVI